MVFNHLKASRAAPGSRPGMNEVPASVLLLLGEALLKYIES